MQRRKSNRQTEIDHKVYKYVAIIVEQKTMNEVVQTLGQE